MTLLTIAKGCALEIPRRSPGSLEAKPLIAKTQGAQSRRASREANPPGMRSVTKRNSRRVPLENLSDEFSDLALLEPKGQTTKTDRLPHSGLNPRLHPIQWGGVFEIGPRMTDFSAV